MESADAGWCENCARPDDDLAAVHRVYVMSEEWDSPERHQLDGQKVLDDVERWCFSCRTQYPHEAVPG